MAHCRNCGSVLAGEFCSACGQRDISYERPIWNLIGSVIGETLEVDGRTANTIKSLFMRPGTLTADYLAGRRTAYTPPLRLYLVFSIAFFLFIAWVAGSGILREPGVDPTFDAAVRARFLSDDLPTLMFVLLPVFALLMKLAYWNRLYFDHLIFSLHVHCIAYVVFSIVLPLEGIADQNVGLLLAQIVFFCAFLGYFGLAVRKVYGSGWMGVILRSIAVLIMYMIIVSVAIETTSELAVISD